MQYIPDDIKIDNIKRSYLLNVNILYNFQVLFNVEREVYNSLYAQFKLIKNSRDTNKWANYYINVTPGISNTIEQYAPVEK